MPMPFPGRRFTLADPDGATVDVRGTGNQFAAVFETDDGYTVVRDPETGFLTYARETDGDLRPTGLRAAGRAPRDGGVTRHARPSRDAVRQRLAGRSLPRWETRRSGALRARAARSMFAETEFVTGDYVGLCLLIEFPDVPATVPPDEVERFLNQPGYTGNGNNGSVRDYFQDVSDGLLTYTNVVTAYHTAAKPRSYYTEPVTSPDPDIQWTLRARELITEALDALVAGGFDFGALTVDDEGFVRALNVLYAGPAVNEWSEGLWPHAWHLGGYDLGGGRMMSDYQITDSGSDGLTLATFCHENGHMICDFPDLYDYGNESFGSGAYCLMAWGGGLDGRNPPQVGAYLKNQAGWTSRLTTVTPGATVEVAAGRNDFAVRWKNLDEYFIIENRQQAGRDAALPDAGLAIWHVDENGDNSAEQMTAEAHYECSLEQADGHFDLEGNANTGDAGDLYASSAGDTFSDATTPDSTWWDGTSSGLAIEDVSAAGPVMTFRSRT